MLLEMATGTGKTLTIAMIIKRWFQSAIISRVLFLVDRLELASQAKDTFEDYLRDYPCTVLSLVSLFIRAGSKGYEKV